MTIEGNTAPMDRTPKQPTTPTADTTVESGTFFQNVRDAFEKPANKALLTTAVLLGTLSLAACSSGEAKPTAPTTSSSAEATPTPEATESADPDRYEGTDFELTEALPENLEYLNTVTPAEFAKAPKADQLAWMSWAEQYKPAFIEMFSAVSGLENDKPYTLTPDSDFTTILRDMQYTDRLAANFGTGTPEDKFDNGTLDKDMVTKLSLAHQSNSNLNVAETYVGNLSTFGEGEALNLSYLAAGGYYDMADKAAKASDLNVRPQNMSLDDKQYNGFQYSFTDPESSTGAVYSAQVSVVEYTDFRGNTAYTVLTF